jgi:multicomponent Na+:H+ antiporter subunit F
MPYSFGLVGLSLLLMMIPMIYRVIVGPTVIDRIVAVNVIGAKTTILLIIIGFMYENVGMFVDLALTYALLNFTGSLAYSRFIQRRRTMAKGEDGLEIIGYVEK